MKSFKSLQIFFRNVQKQKLVTSMTVLGLSLGITVALIIGLWTVQEFNYDKFHQNQERIYRVLWHTTFNNNNNVSSSIMRPLGPEAQAVIPEVEKMCRLVNLEDERIKVNERYFDQMKVAIADENFFEFFTFPLKRGEKNEVLKKGDGIVIDESTATLLFPGENPVGKVVRLLEKDWEVSGIMKDMPANSHLQANLIIPAYGEYKIHHWHGYFYYTTYFLLQKNADIDKVTLQLNRILKEKLSNFKEADARFSLELLKDIHFGAGVMGQANSKVLVFILIGAAAIILLISCINFASLFISMAFARATSIGIRKMHGADRKHLMKDFYKETYYYVLLAIVIAIPIIIGIVPLFNKLLDANLEINIGNIQFYVFLLVLSILVVILAGTFPAIYMTRFNVVQTLSHQFKGNRLSFIQKGLLVLQFAIAFACLTSVFFIHKQVNTMITLNLEGGKENIFYVKLPDKLLPTYRMIREELMKNPSVIEITMKNSLPCEQNMAWQIKRKDDQEPMEYYTEICHIKGNYFDFMNMELVAGENPFDSDFIASSDCVVNETAVRKLDMKNPLGTHLEAYGREFVVKGVVKDAYTKVLYQPIAPQVYLSINSGYTMGYILVKIQGNPQTVIRTVRQIWEDKMPEVNFSYGFLDQAYESLYQREKKLSEILSGLMILTLLISISGLFNMSYYAIGRRLQEVALRKINGATPLNLLVLLNSDFVIWICCALLIAVPCAWLFVSFWQEGFVIKVTLSWWVFALTGIFAVLVTLFTVSYQVIKTSFINPVEVLKQN